MAERRLTPDEDALWRRVMATVRPSRVEKPQTAAPVPGAVAAKPAKPAKPAKLANGASVCGEPATKCVPPKAKLVPKAAPKPGTTLDGGWDKKLATGAAAPDSAIDLHGHTLNSAYAVLDAGLERAIARGDRVLLLITGKPPRPESERPHARGRIRDSVDAWLAASRHAASIAAVRGAHPRHGGTGALYIILRRPRTDQKY